MNNEILKSRLLDTFKLINSSNKVIIYWSVDDTLYVKSKNENITICYCGELEREEIKVIEDMIINYCNILKVPYIISYE